MANHIRNDIYLAALLHCIAEDNETDGLNALISSYLAPKISEDASIKKDIMLAAQLSAGVNADASPLENRSWTAATSRLKALTATIGTGNTGDYFLPDKPLTLSKDSFPKTSFDRKPDYAALKEAFAKELHGLEGKSTAAFTDSMLYLLERYATHVPAFTDGNDDISLFDHAKTTAALARCLYDWRQEGDTNAAPFLLVGADFSGIQGYIYQIISKYAAKSLKGRSFYLRLLSDSVVRFLLDKLGLCRANIVYNSGGGFYLLAPNTVATRQVLEECREHIERMFLKAHGIALYLALDSVELSADDLCLQDEEHSLSRAWTQLFSKRDQVKQSKFSNVLQSDYARFFEPSTRTAPKFDAVTGEEFEDSTSGKNDDGRLIALSRLNAEQQQLGAALKNAEAIVISGSAVASLSPDAFHIEPADLGTHYYFVSTEHLRRHAQELGHSTIVMLNEEAETSVGIQQNTGMETAVGFGYYGGNQNNGKTFDQLCNFGQREFTRLGVLRMDVDNLGKIFQQGLPACKASLSRFAAMSRLFDYFFSGYLNTIYHDLAPEHSQIIYSGGDDLFIVGSWDVMIDIAERIRRDFGEFTCHNPAFSISGGIAIVTAKHPIMNASKESEKEEENAKSHGTEKNAVSFMGMALNWNTEYPAVKKLKDTIVKMIGEENINKSFITKIQQLKEQACILTKMNGTTPVHQVTNMRAYWLLAYTMKRMLLRGADNEAKDFVNQCINEICAFRGKIGGNPVTTTYHPFELWAFAARWAELELRTNQSI